jgi:DNA (cytosine-5)-methyltransferase 1
VRNLAEDVAALPEPGRAGAWGRYGRAVARHQQVLGRPAPPATVRSAKTGNPVLNPAFSEWLMMLPEGHITDPGLGLSRSAMLKLAGNGVVPPQAAEAVAQLLARAAAACRGEGGPR